MGIENNKDSTVKQRKHGIEWLEKKKIVWENLKILLKELQFVMSLKIWGSNNVMDMLTNNYDVKVSHRDSILPRY